MKILRLSFAVSSLAFLAACMPSAPSAPPTAKSMLHSTAFPEGWKAIPDDCGTNVLCFYSPSAYTGANTATDHDFFAVQPVSPGTCDDAFVADQATMDGGDTVKTFTLFGQDVGYQWNGYAGAGVTPGDLYTMRFVCVRHPTEGFDILVSSYIADGKTTDYLDGQFLPFWLHLFITE